MIFRQIREIVRGEKTQTRRVVKPGDKLIPTAVTRNGRKLYEVGKTYAVVPKRGAKAVWWNPANGEYYYDGCGRSENAKQQLRILITDIRREPLQAINEDDALCEGVASVGEYRALWERINGAGSWDKNPDVWVYSFEVVR